MKKSICKDCKFCTHLPDSGITTIDSNGFNIDWFSGVYFCDKVKCTMLDVQKCSGFEKRKEK